VFTLRHFLISYNIVCGLLVFGCLYIDEVSLFALANEVSGVGVLCSELAFIQPVLSESYGYKSFGLPLR